jgi:hypothetical protein
MRTDPFWLASHNLKDGELYRKAKLAFMERATRYYDDQIAFQYYTHKEPLPPHRQGTLPVSFGNMAIDYAEAGEGVESAVDTGADAGRGPSVAGDGSDEGSEVSEEED